MDKKVVFNKSGNFYNCYGDGAVIMHFLKGYRYNYISKHIGFPISVINEITNLLESNRISYEILDKNVVVNSYKGIDKCFDDTLKKGLMVVDKEQRVNRLKEKIDKYSPEELEKLLELIESSDLNEK